MNSSRHHYSYSYLVSQLTLDIFPSLKQWMTIPRSMEQKSTIIESYGSIKQYNAWLFLVVLSLYHVTVEISCLLVLKVSLGLINTIFLRYLHTWLWLEVLIYLSITVYLQKQVHLHCQPAMINTQTRCIVVYYICIEIYHNFIWNIELDVILVSLKTSATQIYIIMSVMKIETDSIVSITASRIGRSVILHVETLYFPLLFLTLMS